MDVERLVARCAFPAAGTALTCAVSGGPDSLALLALATAAGLDVTAVHVDHGLRPGSADESDVVRDAAARFGAAFRAERAHVEPGPNLEARARAARRAVLPAGHAAGHTADDRAETVLLAILRGTGLDGIAALRPGPTHPIVDLRRRETHDLCAALDLVPVRDETNDDLRFRRNRVRHELLPLLDDIAERDVVPLLCRLADLAAADVDVLQALTAEAIPDPTDARAVAAAPPALAARALRDLLRQPADDHHPPDLATLRRALDVAAGTVVATDLGAGRRLSRTRNRLRVDPGSGS